MVIKLSQEQATDLIGEIQSYFDTERSEIIGELAARNLLEFMVSKLGPVIYNQAVGDARTVVLQQMERVDEELYALERPLGLTQRHGGVEHGTDS